MQEHRVSSLVNVGPSRSRLALVTILSAVALAVACDSAKAPTATTPVAMPSQAALSEQGRENTAVVCHVDSGGVFAHLSVNPNALQAHLAHGDGLPGDLVPGVDGKKFAPDCSLVDAVTVTPGTPAYGRGAGLRIKGWNTGKEIFIGPMTSSALPRAEAEYNEFQTVAQKTYSISFSFDPGTNMLAMTIGSPSQAASYDLDTGSGGGCASTGWDTMHVLVRDNKTDSGVALANVMLGPYALGAFGTVDKLGEPGAQNWGVTGFDFSQAWTLTGDLVVDGYTGNESIKVEFTVGCGI